MATTARSVRESIELQLIERGADIALNKSLIDDYLFYYAMEKKMQSDVRKNGIIINAISSTGKAYQKENPAVKLAMLYNKQKLAILKQLEIVPSTVIDPDESEEFADL